MPPRTPEEIKRLLNEKLSQYAELDNMLGTLNERIIDERIDKSEHGVKDDFWEPMYGRPQEPGKPYVNKKIQARIKQSTEAIIKKYGQELHDQIESFFEGPKGYDDASVAEWALENYVALRLLASSDFSKRCHVKSLVDAVNKMHMVASMGLLFLQKYISDSPLAQMGSDSPNPLIMHVYDDYMAMYFDSSAEQRLDYNIHTGSFSKLQEDIRSEVKGIKKNPVKPQAVKETGKVLEQREPEIQQPEPAADVQKAVLAGEAALAEYKVEPEFKERIKELYDAELSPRDEFLFKFYEKNAANGKEAVEQTRKWLTDACELKKAGKDNSELVEKVSQGFRFIREKSAENILKFAAENDEYIKKMRQGSQDEFLEGWARAQVIEHAYRTVFSGVSEASIKPEHVESVKSIAKNMDALNERMKALASPAAPHREEAKPEVKPAPENPAAPGSFVFDRKDLDSYAKELKDAKTTTNSDEYKKIISTIDNWNAIPKEHRGNTLAEECAAQLVYLKTAINDYLDHKGRDGVKKNVYQKLAAVEKLNQFVSEKLKGVRREDLQSAQAKEYYDRIMQDAPKDEAAPAFNDKDLIAKNVSNVQEFGIKTSAEECDRTLRCMDKIISRSENRAEELKEMQQAFCDFPGKEISPAHELAFNAYLSGWQKNHMSAKDKKDYDELLTAEDKRDNNSAPGEISDEDAAALHYAEKYKINCNMEVKKDGEYRTENLPWNEAKKLLDYSLSKTRGNNTLIKVTNFALGYWQGWVKTNISSIRDSVEAHLKANAETKIDLVSAEYNDKQLIEKWPEISREIGPYNDVFDSFTETKTIKQIREKYEKLEERMLELAEPHAKRIKSNKIDKLINPEERASSVQL